ncbi:MAG: glycosyltransferase family 4 protein [Bdellovibrio sp.]|nr:glycosyltransferase family 4 protein [Bdellovibrio sp.]
MKKIALISDQLTFLGGVRASILSLCYILQKAGYTIELGQNLDDVHNPDILWTHSPSNLSLVLQLKDWHERHPHCPFIYQVHDYREICLTGRKSCGKELAPCWREMGLECFAIHYSQGCGPTLNPVKLAERYKLIKEQIGLMKLSTKVVVFSDYVRDQLGLNGICLDKIFKTLPYFVPPEPTEISNQRTDTDTTALWYGRFTLEKGPFHFINLIHQLKESKVPLSKAWMIGEGPLEKALHLLSHECELDDVLTFINWARPQHLWRYICSSSFVHFSSLWPEPFGLLGIESMALGVPVIGRPVGGSHEWLRSEFGHVAVNSDDVGHVFDAAATLLSQPSCAVARAEKLKSAFQDNFNVIKQIESINRMLQGI